jgi:hypothetical protein
MRKFIILPIGHPYTGIDLKAEHDFVGLTTKRRGTIILKVQHIDGRKTDLSFNPNEVKEIES